MHPLASDPHVEMGEFARRAGQDARRTGRAEAVQRLGRDLPDFTGGEDVLGFPARQHGQHVGGIDAAALVWSNAPEIIGAHDTGPLIRSANGFWLAIPLPAAGKALGGKRITPGMWEQKIGLRLRFVYRSRGPSLLVADTVRLTTSGQAAVSKSKTGRGQVTAPIFLLIRQVKLPKRLDLARDVERSLAAIPGSIVVGWRQ